MFGLFKKKKTFHTLNMLESLKETLDGYTGIIDFDPFSSIDHMTQRTGIIKHLIPSLDALVEENGLHADFVETYIALLQVDNKEIMMDPNKDSIMNTIEQLKLSIKDYMNVYSAGDMEGLTLAKSKINN